MEREKGIKRREEKAEKTVKNFWLLSSVTPFDRRTRKPHAARKHHGSMFDRTGVIADRSFTFLAPVTLTLTR